MSTTELATTLPPADLVESINAEHAACERSYLGALEHGVRCGSMLVQVRKALPHGTWRNWLEESFSGSQRTAEVYIQLHHAHQQDPAALAEAGGIRAALNTIARKVSGTQTTFDQADDEPEVVDAEIVEPTMEFVTEIRVKHSAAGREAAEEWTRRLIERIDGTVIYRNTSRR